jgi:Neprosin
MSRTPKPLVNTESRENIRRLKRDVPRVEVNVKRFKEEITAHFQAQQHALEIVKTTRTASGQRLDWVPIESQLPRGKKIATPPSEDIPARMSAGKRAVQPVKFELEHDYNARGPDGTVPILRRDLRKMRYVKSLDDFLSKHGHKTYSMFIDERESVEVPADNSSHEYGNSSQWVTCYGGEGALSAFDPYVHRSDEFSLLQIALVRGAGNGRQTIEAGWQEYRDLYGDWVPHLFVFYTTNGYSKSGDNLGGYNRDVQGWVQYSSEIYPETTFSPTNVRGGAQYEIQIKYQLWQGNWWLRCNGKWIGYYPASLFNANGLRNQAEKIAFYGEIVDSAGDAASTWTDMGSGHWPNRRWTWAGYMKNLKYQSGSAGAMAAYAGSTWESNPTEYGIEEHFSDTGSWGSYAWVGGPGAG